MRTAEGGVKHFLDATYLRVKVQEEAVTHA